MKTKMIITYLLTTLLFISSKVGINLNGIVIREKISGPLENWYANTNPPLGISGTIANYDCDECTITENSFFTGAKTTIGTIDKNGNFTIPLDPDYFNTGKNRMAEMEKNMPRGGEIRYHRVNTIFKCNDEAFGVKNTTETINDSISVMRYPLYGENNQATFNNGETIISKLPLLYLTDQQGNSKSLLFAASTLHLAEKMYHGFGDVTQGYYLELIFVESEATVNGACVIPMGANIGEEFTNTTITDVELQKGWNIIKHDITEVFTPSVGKIQASMTKISAISELPKDVKWFAIDNEN